MPATHSSAAQWDLPQHGHQCHRESRLPVATWQEPHLQGGPTSTGCKPATSSYSHRAMHGTCETHRRVGPISRSAAFSRWAWGSYGEAGGKADQKPQAVAPPHPPKRSHSTLSLGAQLHLSLPWSVSIKSGHQRTACPEVFSNCITWLLKDMASPAQPLAQADLGYYRRDCTLLMNQGRELSK